MVASLEVCFFLILMLAFSNVYLQFFFLGDTDSVFTKWHTDQLLTSQDAIKEAILKKAKDVSIAASKKFSPCILVVEVYYEWFWALPKKKTYAAKTSKGTITIKGMTAIKRDKCEIARQIGVNVIHKIINEKGQLNLAEYLNWLEREIREKIPWGVVSNHLQALF